MLVGTLSRRAKRLLLEALLSARERGADSIDVNDLAVALITEDQNPDSLELNEQHPDVKRFLEKEPRPPAVLFRRTCWIPREPFFAPEVAADLLAKLKEILPRSNPRTDGIQTSPEFERAFDVAEQLRNEFHQSEVQPLNVLAAVLREPCQATPMLQEAGMTEEEVLRILGSGSDAR